MAVRKGKQTLIQFALIDSTSRPTRKSGLTFSAGETKISKDGGAFANTTNQPSEISSGRYKITLTAAEMAADSVHLYVAKTGADNMDLVLITNGHPTGVVVADGANTATTFETDRAETDDDYWKDALLLFTSGSLVDQVKKVSNYDGTTKFVTLSAAFTAAPSAGDRFVFINL